ncbi:hypothetical protein, partial [Moellerella wisconsensis]|uniref:hypothetical protein n=1 Tax=Moellerella wisconsensis TaxID=158849 RepID=UPI0030764041
MISFLADSQYDPKIKKTKARHRPQTNGDIMGTLLPFVYSRVLRGIPDTPKPLRVFFLTRCACP